MQLLIMEPLIEIKIASIADVADITDIYNQAIRLQSCTCDLTQLVPSEKEDWLLKFDDRYPIWKLVYNQKTAGYLYLTPYRGGREAVSSVAEVSYYVHQDYHRMGLGALLLQHALIFAKTNAISHLLAIVLECNMPSVKLLERFGFQLWGCFPKIAHLQGHHWDHLYYGRVV